MHGYNNWTVHRSSPPAGKPLEQIWDLEQDLALEASLADIHVHHPNDGGMWAYEIISIYLQSRLLSWPKADRGTFAI